MFIVFSSDTEKPLDGLSALFANAQAAPTTAVHMKVQATASHRGL